MKQEFDDKKAARERVRQYEASMAIEDMHLSDEGRAVIEQNIEEGLSREEGQARIIESLKERGIIPTDEANIAAE
ncbi:MAG: hypothetical protein ABJH52_17215 [Henriciella sp.]